MNFLAPLFLLGGLALAGPLIFHLIRRTTRERSVFSSLMFLLPTPPRLAKRSRLEDILLLLLRCLALALLAFGFARPYFKDTPLVDPGAAAPKHIVVLVDVSASMRRAGVWAAARERVDTVLRRAASIDEVSLLTFDRQATTLLSFEEWNRTPAGERAALASGRLATVTPGWSGTRLGNSLITAAEILADNDQKRATGPRQVVLVSDLQAGSRLDALQAYEWPKGVQLFVEPVKASTVTNAGLQLVAAAAETPRLDEPVVRVRVSNSADAKREQFQVGWARPADPARTGPEGAVPFAAPAIDLYVPPGQSRVAAVPVPMNSPGLNRIILRGDDDEFDNTVFVIPPEPQRLNVLWLGDDSPDDTRQPLFFLRRALAETPRLSVQIVARPATAPLLADEVTAATLIFVAGDLPAGRAAALREPLLGGQTVVFMPKSAGAAPALAALLGQEGVTLTEARPDNYAMLAEIDFRHPLFAPFADPKFSDFTKIHFWKYRKVDVSTLDSAQAIARFDNGDPALLEVPVGKGRLLVLTSGWQPDDSQLAVSSKFVPLLYSLLELSGAMIGESVSWVVGDTLPAAAGGAPAAAPGIVEFTDNGRGKRLAVNLDATESRTAPLSSDELERLGVPVVQPTAVGPVANKSNGLLQAAESENRQKLWRWFLAAALVVLLLESVLAGWTARRVSLKMEETVP